MFVGNGFGFWFCPVCFRCVQWIVHYSFHVSYNLNEHEQHQQQRWRQKKKVFFFVLVLFHLHNWCYSYANVRVRHIQYVKNMKCSREIINIKLLCAHSVRIQPNSMVNYRFLFCRFEWNVKNKEENIVRYSFSLVFAPTKDTIWRSSGGDGMATIGYWFFIIFLTNDILCLLVKMKHTIANDANQQFPISTKKKKKWIWSVVTKGYSLFFFEPNNLIMIEQMKFVNIKNETEWIGIVMLFLVFLVSYSMWFCSIVTLVQYLIGNPHTYWPNKYSGCSVPTGNG